MQTFTGWEYLLIDVANHWGMDKARFEERIEWATAHLEELEELAKDRVWKDKPMYLKTCYAIRKAQKGMATGHLVGFDAVCSGMQIMSALTGCHAGAKATGLIDPDRRADAYTDCTEIMQGILGYKAEDDRDRVKDAVMTSLYGSKKRPKVHFGDDTPELQAFYKAMWQLCPGACELLQDLLNSWRPYALSHDWVLPDGFQVKIKVMDERVERIEVDELDHTTFTYTWFENMGVKKDVKNAANVIHSVDAYVLRSLIRRCNYDRDVVLMAADEFTCELLNRAAGIPKAAFELSEQVADHVEHYQRSGIADPVILDHLTTEDIRSLDTDHSKALNVIVNAMLEHPPFEIVTVHDDFKCHPNHMNYLRMHYRDILAELADSNLVSDLLSQVYQSKGCFKKLSHDLGDHIRKSNYALC